MYKALIVEDNTAFREAFIRLLSGRFNQMEIESASTGHTALEKFRAFYPNLVVMDIHLPDGNGLELTRKIRLTDRDVIIMILTSHDGPEYRQIASTNGANFFISKTSASSDEILDIVESILPQQLHFESEI